MRRTLRRHQSHRHQPLVRISRDAAIGRGRDRNSDGGSFFKGFIPMGGGLDLPLLRHTDPAAGQRQESLALGEGACGSLRHRHLDMRQLACHVAGDWSRHHQVASVAAQIGDGIDGVCHYFCESEWRENHAQQRHDHAGQDQISRKFVYWVNEHGISMIEGEVRRGARYERVQFSEWGSPDDGDGWVS